MLSCCSTLMLDMSMTPQEAQAAAAVRKEQRQIAHQARVAAEMAAKAERKAARAAAIMGERKTVDVQGRGAAPQGLANEASISVAQYADVPPLETELPATYFSDPAIQQTEATMASKRAQMDLQSFSEERRLAHAKMQEDQRQLALLRAEEKKRAYEASLAQIAENKARKAVEVEERRLLEEANRAAKLQRKEANMRSQRESQRKAMLDKATLEITVTCEQLLAAVQAQILAHASQAGEIVKVAPASFGGGDMAFTVRFKDQHATQTCLNMTLPPIQLSVPLFAKPSVVPACYLNFELPHEVNPDEQVQSALHSLFAEFGTVVETKIVPPRTALIHFQEPDVAFKIVDQQFERTLSLFEHPLSGLEVGKPSPGKRKRG